MKDCNGNILVDGDTVIAIKDLKGKGVNIKRGDKFKNIHLTDEDGVIEETSEIFNKNKQKSDFLEKIAFFDEKT